MAHRRGDRSSSPLTTAIAATTRPQCRSSAGTAGRVLSLTIEAIEDSITPTQVRRLVEIRDSRRIIRRIFGVRANNFTYPAGMYDGRAVAAVGAAGYRGAVTVAPGLASRDNRLEIRRIRVTDDMGTRGLAAALGR